MRTEDLNSATDGHKEGKRVESAASGSRAPSPAFMIDDSSAYGSASPSMVAAMKGTASKFGVFDPRGASAVARIDTCGW